jgi:hypothetical protein
MAQAHLFDDSVGVSEGHVAGDRGKSIHAVKPGVVNDDQIGSPRFSEFRRKTDPGPNGQDRFPFLDFRPQPPKNFATSVLSSQFSSPYLLM